MSKKFISIWNEIKKFPGFVGKNITVGQLNDSTVFPWILNFVRNFSADYRQCKSNRWDYLVPIHEFKNLTRFIPSSQKDLLDKRIYLINKYNERLLFYSNDKANPWVIDNRDNNCLVLYKKNYLEFKTQIAFLIDIEIAKQVANKTLTKKNILVERERLEYLAKLVLLKTCKEESLEEFIAFSVTSLEYQIAIDQFKQLITQEIKLTFIKKQIKKIKNQQQKIVTDLYVDFFKKTEKIKIYSILSIWEKINKFVIKNKSMHFFFLLWNGLSSHANVLNWINFLLLFFSLSLLGYPIIFYILGASFTGYLIFLFFYLGKKDSVIFPTIFTDEAKRILELVKIEVFNEEKNKNELKLIYEIVDSLSAKKLNLHEFLKSISDMQSNFDPIYLSSLTIENSKLYQYLTEVYPKTQFVASLIINLTSIVLYTYLITWAIQSVLLFVGALSMATFITSPVVVGVLILVAATFFLLSHLCEFRAREDFYQRTVLNKLNELCDYHYKDEYGVQQIVKVEKWKKFEYLQDNIDFLELAFKNFFEANKLESLNDKFYSIFTNCMSKKNIYSCCDQDKVLGCSSTGFKKFKKFLNRSFAFFGGGFYGYNIGQQIVWKSNLGFHMVVKTLTLSLFFIFFPLIIIMGIANLITYHLHSRQRIRFEVLNNLDSKLELLEQINKKFLFLTTLFPVDFLRSSVPDANIETSLERQSDLSIPNKNDFFKKANNLTFFKETYQKESALEKRRSLVAKTINNS